MAAANATRERPETPPYGAYAAITGAGNHNSATQVFSVHNRASWLSG